VAAAVRAGYHVIAIDAFADKQTVALAESTIVVDYDQYGFNAESLLSAIGKLDTSQYLGFVYGSGFDAQPALLQKIANILPLIGNVPDVVRAVKTSSVFFDSLMQCNIAYPKTCSVLPASDVAGTYLQKFAGGCGGAHIQWVSDDAVLEANHYYQQHMIGRSVSLLFIANGDEIAVVGFNEQWLSPTANMPFRYGGAVSRIELTKTVQLQLEDAADRLTRKFGLFGLNSLDTIVQNDVVYVLEINPRLSATVDLYEDENLLDRHVQALVPQREVTVTKAKAHCIVYAEVDTAIPSAFEWPSWVVDTPQETAIDILLGAPICTVLAHADFAEDAKQLANARAKVMQQLLQ
jgi:predicted ATP-grasp superfamily ATP-dependent carboligase